MVTFAGLVLQLRGPRPAETCNRWIAPVSLAGEGHIRWTVMQLLHSRILHPLSSCHSFCPLRLPSAELLPTRRCRWDTEAHMITKDDKGEILLVCFSPGLSAFASRSEMTLGRRGMDARLEKKARKFFIIIIIITFHRHHHAST